MKNALFFGASSGIGYHLAEFFLENKYNVINCSRGNSPDKRVTNITCDTSVPKDIDQAFQKITASIDSLSYFVYSSGTSMAAPFEYTQEKDSRYLMEVNFLGLAKATRLALPLVKNAKGKIIFISSLGGVIPIPYDPFYSASKAAVNMLANELRIELAEYGVDVISVLPGGTATDFTFNRLIYTPEQCGEYAGRTMRAARSLAAIEQGGMTPQAVAQEIYFNVTSEKPPVILTTGAKNKLLKLSGKMLPRKAMLKTVKKTYGI